MQTFNAACAANFSSSLSISAAWYVARQARTFAFTACLLFCELLELTDEEVLLTDELETLEPVELVLLDDELAATAVRMHVLNARRASAVVCPTVATVEWYVARH